MHWDYLKRWTNFWHQLSKRNVTPKIIFARTKKSCKIHHKPLKCDSLLFHWHLLGIQIKHASIVQPKGLFSLYYLFHFNVKFSLSVFYKLLKSTVTSSTFFTLYDVWNAFWQCLSPFDLRSCRLRPFSDVQRYNDMLMCVYCKAWNSYAIKVKCSQLTL